MFCNDYLGNFSITPHFQVQLLQKAESCRERERFTARRDVRRPACDCRFYNWHLVKIKSNIRDFRRKITTGRWWLWIRCMSEIGYYAGGGGGGVLVVSSCVERGSEVEEEGEEWEREGGGGGGKEWEWKVEKKKKVGECRGRREGEALWEAEVLGRINFPRILTHSHLSWSSPIDIFTEISWVPP